MQLFEELRQVSSYIVMETKDLMGLLNICSCVMAFNLLKSGFMPPALKALPALSEKINKAHLSSCRCHGVLDHGLNLHRNIHLNDQNIVHKNTFCCLICSLDLKFSLKPEVKLEL